MATIRITREHNLDQNAARKAVQQLADKLASELSVQCSWKGDRLEFTRSGADGYIELGDGKLQLEIKLGFLLTPMQGKIESSVQDYLERNLS